MCLGTDSLYNPNYGYFSKQAVIFSPGEPFEFWKMKDEFEFQRQLGQRYTAFEDALDAKEPNPTRQLWHTPTELFRPWYGEAVARYLLENYRQLHYPQHDLIIYELGAGNGTLMLNILDYIRAVAPAVYARTQFRVVEISAALAAQQARLLHATPAARAHRAKIAILNRSIFEWDAYEPAPCFVLAFEVADNFAHDVVRYDPFTEAPLQGTVLIDAQGDFHEFYVRALDAETRRFLDVRAAACGDDCALPAAHPLAGPRMLRRLRASLPLAGNLTVPEYLPVRLMHFFEVLDTYFPLHRLVLSDFHALPDTVPGYNAPVVQTRYQRRTIPVTTPLVGGPLSSPLPPSPTLRFSPLVSIFSATQLISKIFYLKRPLV
jgi:hypothetical protein